MNPKIKGPQPAVIPTGLPKPVGPSPIGAKKRPVKKLTGETKPGTAGDKASEPETEGAAQASAKTTKPKKTGG